MNRAKIVQEEEIMLLFMINDKLKQADISRTRVVEREAQQNQRYTVLT